MVEVAKPNPFVERFVNVALDREVTDGEIQDIAKSIRSWDGNISYKEVGDARAFKAHFLELMTSWAKSEMEKLDAVAAKLADTALKHMKADPKLSVDQAAELAKKDMAVDFQRLELAEAFLNDTSLKGALWADADRLATTLEKEQFNPVTRWIARKINEHAKKPDAAEASKSWPVPTPVPTPLPVTTRR